MRRIALGILLAGVLAACGNEQTGAPASATTALINPEIWPEQAPTVVRDADMEQRIADLLDRMTLEEKVGQVMQADIADVTPEQVREYNIGSVLNGGNSAPLGDNRTAPENWLALADEFWDASTDTSDGGVGIPTIWGTDAMHGHSNVLGATLFPHNIGLGMADDPDMMYDIGRVTALEMRATGLDWTFAPTVAVTRDDRWGRTYESFSEDPRIVAAYAPRMVEGLQGVLGSPEFLDADHMIATAKHYVGDGGTLHGTDQGDNVSSEAELRDIHAAGYYPAVAAGVQTVMASYNSFHGRKMHGIREMLTDVLVGRMGFDGFIVGDWNGHGQVEGCTKTDCAASFNAGLDMFMAPDSWEELYHTTLAQVRSGEISEARLDEAVSRILRVKMRAGIFDAGRPSSRKHAGNFDLLSAPAHRATAREAVRKTLVMLKNENGVLPISSDAKVLLAGDGAHSIGKQSGGWTLNWQGIDNLNEHFPGGMSIFDGFVEAMEAGGGLAILSEDGSYAEKPDVAIVVFGEDPYAEGLGDRPTVDYNSDDGLKLLRKFDAAGIPTVSVFISGRTLWTNPEINASSAFVAAWLPGTEGGGIADVLVGNADGSPRHDFQGRLSFSWPRSAVQSVVNVGDEDYDPQFAYGHGLSYADDGMLPELSEDSGITGSLETRVQELVSEGDPVRGWQLLMVEDAELVTRVSNSRGRSANGRLTISSKDREVQEDTIIASWAGDANLVVFGQVIDLAEETGNGMAVQLEYQVVEAGASPVSIGMARVSGPGGVLDITSAVAEKSGSGWQIDVIPLSCFADAGADMSAVDSLFFGGGEGLVLQLEAITLVENPGDAGCP